MAIGTRWAEERGLAAAVEVFFPTYRARVLGDARSRGRGERVGRIALSRHTLDLTAKSANEFVSKNGECLYLSIGAQGVGGLRESAMSGVSDDRETLALWRALGRELKASMHVGASIRNPKSGALGDSRHHRHSAGAHALSEGGTPMLAAGGWVEYDFTDRIDLPRVIQRR